MAADIRQQAHTLGVAQQDAPTAFVGQGAPVAGFRDHFLMTDVAGAARKDPGTLALEDGLVEVMMYGQNRTKREFPKKDPKLYPMPVPAFYGSISFAPGVPVQFRMEYG